LSWWLPMSWVRQSNNFISRALNCAIWISSSIFSLLRFLFSSMSIKRLLSSMASVALSRFEASKYAGNVLGSHFFRVISTSMCLLPLKNFSCLNSHCFVDVFLNPCLLNYIFRFTIKNRKTMRLERNFVYAHKMQLYHQLQTAR